MTPNPEFSGVRFGFLLSTSDGKAWIPGEWGGERLMRLKHADELVANGAQGFVLIFYIPNAKQLTKKTIEKYRQKVANIIKCKSCTEGNDP